MTKSTFALFTILVALAPLACGDDDASDPIAVAIGDGGPSDGGAGNGDGSDGGGDSAGDAALATDTGAPDQPGDAGKMDGGGVDLPGNLDSGVPGGADARVDLGPSSLDGPQADGGACMPTVHPGTITFIDQVSGQIRVENLADVPENLWWRTTAAGRIPVVTVISRLTPAGRVEITLYGPCDQLLERTTA